MKNIVKIRRPTPTAEGVRVLEYLQILPVPASFIKNPIIQKHYIDFPGNVNYLHCCRGSVKNYAQICLQALVNEVSRQ